MSKFATHPTIPTRLTDNHQSAFGEACQDNVDGWVSKSICEFVTVLPDVVGIIRKVFSCSPFRIFVVSILNNRGPEAKIERWDLTRKSTKKPNAERRRRNQSPDFPFLFQPSDQKISPPPPLYHVKKEKKGRSIPTEPTSRATGQQPLLGRAQLAGSSTMFADHARSGGSKQPVKSGTADEPIPLLSCAVVLPGAGKDHEAVNGACRMGHHICHLYHFLRIGSPYLFSVVVVVVVVAAAATSTSVLLCVECATAWPLVWRKLICT